MQDTFKSKNNSLIHEIEIYTLISNLLHNVIEENEPHIWYKTEEPFISSYTGKLSYDYSGEVRKMTLEELIDLKENLGLSEYAQVCCESNLDELLSRIYINQWSASYTSNYGKNWITFKDLLEESFNDWKYESFEIYDEDGEEIVENLDISLDEVLVKFLKETDFELYYKKVLNQIK